MASQLRFSLPIPASLRDDETYTVQLCLQHPHTQNEIYLPQHIAAAELRDNPRDAGEKLLVLPRDRVPEFNGGNRGVGVSAYFWRRGKLVGSSALGSL